MPFLKFHTIEYSIVCGLGECAISKRHTVGPFLTLLALLMNIDEGAALGQILSETT